MDDDEHNISGNPPNSDTLASPLGHADTAFQGVPKKPEESHPTATILRESAEWRLFSSIDDEGVVGGEGGLTAHPR